MITEIKSGTKVFAIVVDLSDIQEGTFAATHPSWSIQILMMKRPKGHVVRKHTHKKILKSTKQPQEAIVVIKGAIEASIFDGKESLIAKQPVAPGQCILMVDGIHEVTMTKNALVYAFKDGPHVDDKVFI